MLPHPRAQPPALHFDQQLQSYYRHERAPVDQMLPHCSAVLRSQVNTIFHTHVVLALSLTCLQQQKLERDLKTSNHELYSLNLRHPRTLQASRCRQARSSGPKKGMPSCRSATWQTGEMSVISSSYAFSFPEGGLPAQVRHFRVVGRAPNVCSLAIFIYFVLQAPGLSRTRQALSNILAASPRKYLWG